LAVALTAGQSHDSTCFEPVFEASRLPRTPRRARSRPDKVAADKAYNVEWIREWLKRRHIEPVIPRRVPENAPGELFDREAYKGRNIIERCIGWLKECRRVFSRFDKLARSYLAFLKLAMLQRILKIDF
jgi:transposase